MVISKEASRLDDMMRKVEGLLKTADSFDESNPEAAANYRAQAERIMLKYKIEQEDLIKRGDLRVDGLSVMFKEVSVYDYTSDFSNVYWTLLHHAVRHAGVKAKHTGYDVRSVVITFVGYESDIRYAEALYQNARLVFADRMEPRVDPSLSDEDNVYRLRNAGIERPRIAEMMGWGREKAQKVTTVYKRACKARGEDPALTGKGNMMADYRVGYSNGFVYEFSTRLRQARIAVEDEIKDGGMVLHGREERIMEAMYQRWPEMRPSTEVAAPETKPAKARKWTKADERRWEKANNATARLGQNAGRKAAAEINVSNTPRKRLD